MKTITINESTYNTETGTTLQTRIIPLYEYYELNDGAQAHALAAFMDERANDPYFSQWFNDCYESEIWDCVRELEKAITGARVEWHYNRWYSADFDCEYKLYNDGYPCAVYPVENTGYYASMDLCDTWNNHTKKLTALAYHYEYLDYLCWDKYGDHEQRYDPRKPFYKAEDMQEKIFEQWQAELEQACDNVRNTIETLLRGEWDYYTSEEYAQLEFEDESTQGYRCYTTDGTRKYYHDSRKWYTADGEFYEQSDVCHECVSIVKVS